MSPFSFLILVICVFSLFSLSVSKGLSVWWSFPRTDFWFLLFSLLFSYSLFHLSPFCSFIIFFLLLALGLVFCFVFFFPRPFSSSSKCKVKLLIWGLSFFDVGIYSCKFLSWALLLLHSVNFSMFCFHSSQGIF